MKITFGHRHEVEQRKFKIFSGLLPIRAGLLHLYIVEREMFFMNLYPCNPCHPWSSPCGLLWALRVSAVHPRAVPGFGGWPAAGTISDRFSPGSLTKPLQIQHFRKTVYRPAQHESGAKHTAQPSHNQGQQKTSTANER